MKNYELETTTYHAEKKMSGTQYRYNVVRFSENSRFAVSYEDAFIKDYESNGTLSLS